tara:strand:- start:93 stop:563 length:471 start_codon:yes stop_codon:yes gene_type:complete
MKKIFINFVCSWVCCWLAFYPALAHAQETEVTTNQPIPLTTGDTAPFNGVLIPTLQAAEMTARLEQQEAQCNLRIESEIQTALSRSQLLLDNCNSFRQTYDEMYKSQLASQRDYIDFLEKKATAPKIPREVVFIIGIVAGVGITIGAGYAMHAAAN